MDNLPVYLKLSEKFSHRKDQIEFITISTDRKDAYHEWKYLLAPNGLMRMVNLISPDEDKYFSKNFGFTGVPRYMVIDPDGVIVTISAPSPDSPALERLINKSMNEYYNKNKEYEKRNI